MLIRNNLRTRIHARAIAPAALLLFFLAGFTASSTAAPPRPPSPDETLIRALLEDQTAAWNRGDIEGFMAGYWKSDETEFVSAEGISRGWQALLERYRRGYPDGKAMGRLSFANLEIHIECPNSAYAVGEYHLQREKDNPAGVFTLNFRKFSEGWRVIVDHTSAFAQPASPAKRD